MARLTVCADFQPFAPVQAIVETPPAPSRFYVVCQRGTACRAIQADFFCSARLLVSQKNKVKFDLACFNNFAKFLAEF
jgi:hypothetical protein